MQVPFTPRQRHTLRNSIIAIIGVLLAALVAWLSGCRITADRDGGTAEFLYPRMHHKHTIQLSPCTQPDSPPDPD